MDDNVFRSVLARMTTPGQAPSNLQDQDTGTAAPQGTLDDATFNRLLATMHPGGAGLPQGTGTGSAQGQTPPTLPPGAEPGAQAPADASSQEDAGDYIFEGGGDPASRQYTPAPPTGHADPSDPTKGGMFPAGGQYANPNAPANAEPGLSDPSAPLTEAPVAGGAKALYETKDFLLGQTPQADRSSIRKAIEAGPNAANATPAYRLSEGIAQFATGMYGAGKIMEAARGVKALGAAYEAVHGARGGAAAIESAKAAAAGAIAFDPHAERLSNLVQEVPSLANPVTGYLAAKPDDSAAMGRFKNAMESLGLDSLTIGALAGGTAILKGIRAGYPAIVRSGSAETLRALDGRPDSGADVGGSQTADAVPLGVRQAAAAGDIESKALHQQPKPEAAKPADQPAQAGSEGSAKPDTAPPTAGSPEPLKAASDARNGPGADAGAEDPLHGQEGVAFQPEAAAPGPTAAENPYTHTSTVLGGHFAPTELAGSSDGLQGIYYKGAPDGSARIDSAGLPEGMRGSGQGTAMYKAFVDRMHGAGRDVTSDIVTSPMAAKVYAKLRDAGYDVRENSNVHITPDGGRITTDGQPIFTVKRPMPEAQTVVDSGGRSFTKAAPGEPYRLDTAPLPMPEPVGGTTRGLIGDTADWADVVRKVRDQSSPGTFTNRLGVTVPTNRTATLGDILEHHQPSPQSGIGQSFSLSRKLLATAKDVPVHFVGDAEMDKAWQGLHPTVRRAGGFFDPTQRAIVVRSGLMAHPEEGAKLIVHEGAHAALHHLIETNKTARASLEGLITIINKALGDKHQAALARADRVDAEMVRQGRTDRAVRPGAPGGWYGLKDAHELVSEAMSNPAFQQELASIDLPASLAKTLGLETTARPTLWDAFVARVKKIFAVPDEKKTALDAVLRITDRLQQDAEAGATARTAARHTKVPEVVQTNNGTGGGEGRHADWLKDFDPLAAEMRGGDAFAGSGRDADTGATPRFAGLTPDQVQSIYAGISSDLEAFIKFGSWDEAIDSGHVFGKGGSIPYQKIADGGDGALSAFIARAADELKGDFDAAKGGAKLSDERVDQLVMQRVRLYGEDPAALYGMIGRAGEDANALVANMEAAYMLAQRAGQDATTLAMRMRIGALDEFGGDHAAAVEELKRRVQLFSQAWAAGQSMRAASGRAMRRLRGDFRLSPEDLQAIRDVDPDALVIMLNTTGGDPRLIKEALQPGLLRRVVDGAQFLYVNNLLWGLRTHIVNFATNGYMLTGRPLERILGSLVQSKVAGPDAAADALRIRQEALRQYTYMGASLSESWKAAVETWRLGDSVMSPHQHELLNQGVVPAGGGTHALGASIAQAQFGPWNNIPDILRNVFMVAAPKTLGLPTRALGSADEMVKQVVYRSKVLAAAHVDGLSQGLEGEALSGYVKNRLYDSFDGAGRAIDADALKEAQTATFQQDLLPGTLGAATQKAAAENTFVRFILPFVKTPANVLRMGWKMTPGLNLLQKEYRGMLKGEQGAEAQAQAYGQMAMGSLFLGTAAYLAHQGRITGGGPSDPEAQRALKATGWQPYSIVTTNADGSKTYTNYGRYDPIAMPLGMVADIIDVLSADLDSHRIQKAGSMVDALFYALTQSIGQKTYLKGLDNAIQAITSPDKQATRFFGTMAGNLVPMSSNLRQLNPDAYMREARTFVDYLKAGVPGFSTSLPAQRDAFGDPVTVHKGLWVDGGPGIVDSEIRRMASDPGNPQTVGPPSPIFRGGVDLRDVTMEDGSNAYDKLQQHARAPGVGVMPIKDQLARVMETASYKAAPDGDAKTAGTKMAILSSVMANYRQAAEGMMMGDANVRAAALAKAKAVQAAYANRPGQMNPTTPNNAATMTDRLTKSLTPLVSPMMGLPPQ